MVKVTSKTTIESIAAPGVVFTVRRLGKIHRAARDLEILPEVQAYRSDCIEAASLLRSAGYTITPDGTYERAATDPISPEIAQSIAELDDRLTNRLRAHIVPASIKAGLLSIEGLEVDGVAVTTVDGLLEAGPEANALLDEIYDAIEHGGKLTEEEKKQSAVAA